MCSVCGDSGTIPHGAARLLFKACATLFDHHAARPNFHHWHDASDDEAIDKNYAAYYAFVDYLFGTAVKSKNKFPESYGVVGDYMPDGFVKPQLFPFRDNKTARDPAQRIGHASRTDSVQDRTRRRRCGAAGRCRRNQHRGLRRWSEHDSDTSWRIGAGTE